MKTMDVWDDTPNPADPDRKDTLRPGRYALMHGLTTTVAIAIAAFASVWWTDVTPNPGTMMVFTVVALIGCVVAAIVVNMHKHWLQTLVGYLIVVATINILASVLLVRFPQYLPWIGQYLTVHLPYIYWTCIGVPVVIAVVGAIVPRLTDHIVGIFVLGGVGLIVGYIYVGVTDLGLGYFDVLTLTDVIAILVLAAWLTYIAHRALDVRYTGLNSVATSSMSVMFFLNMLVGRLPQRKKKNTGVFAYARGVRNRASHARTGGDGTGRRKGRVLDTTKKTP